jgi:hypothetical protein
MLGVTFGKGGFAMKNSIFVIKPYKWEGLWVFDDANVGLVKEPFVGGADKLTANSRQLKARQFSGC